MLYEKYIEFNPQNCSTWIKYAELEAILGDLERTRAIYELAIEQPLLDMPEIIWKSYIDFEIEQEEHDKVRKLYTRLLERTQHVKVWLSYAQFETNLATRQAASEDESEARPSPNFDKVREVYKKAFEELKSTSNKETRVMVLEAWREFEANVSQDEAKVTHVNSLMPKEIRKRRKVQSEDGVSSPTFLLNDSFRWRLISLCSASLL